MIIKTMIITTTITIITIIFTLVAIIIIIVTKTVKIRAIVMILSIRSNYKEFGWLFQIFCAK